MSVVAAGIDQTKVDSRSGKSDLAKLLKATKFHPKGRVRIDPETNKVIGTENNIIEIIEKPIEVETKEGHKIVVGTKKYALNGGHCLSWHPLTAKQDCCWRMGLSDTSKKSEKFPFGHGGPKMYHMKRMKDDEMYAYNPYVNRFSFEGKAGAPELEREPSPTPTGVPTKFSESQEYQLYLQCLKEKDLELVDNLDFYEWMEERGVEDVKTYGGKVTIEYKDDEEEAVPKHEEKPVETARGRGRPPGSKNKVKTI